MNHLAPAGDGGYRLARHAHLVVYTERDDGDLLTVYDCGAAQKPPAAQFIGHLVRVQADARTERTPTGYVVRLSEGGRLEEQAPGEWVVRPVRESDDG
ncbi:hypothetical protein [Halomarina ordinaria]|uniref:Uncharacterized protein n=1 Tax=Halomarina ordinaria TaxID=3033939 RepID=A0ABD5U5W2_9EURY|nr:hypothetical protein [Halomarina sp. PSRA2]